MLFFFGVRARVSEIVRVRLHKYVCVNVRLPVLCVKLCVYICVTVRVRAHVIVFV